MPRSSRKNQRIALRDLFDELPRRRLEGDWLAVDEAGRVAARERGRPDARATDRRLPAPRGRGGRRGVPASAVCSGCRVLSRADDPHPRAPEVLAAAGLFVFAHTGGDGHAPYVRVASPTIAADLADLEAIVADLARRVPLPVRFDEHETFYP